jgi:5'-nucleotidase/UDP-sugar diphosphatase
MNRYLMGVVALAAVAGGCASNKQTASKPALTPIVTDIAPMPPAPVYSAPVAQPVQPVSYAAPAAAEPAAGGATTLAGGSYVVKHGDTLYKLARDHYGDGKQWTKIASANPGLSPQTLKVGQKIVIP